MSRKTKQEKKIAEYRKKLKLLEQLAKHDIPVIKKSNSEPAKSPPKELNTVKPENESKKIYFLNDLKKSSLIILFIITLELIIYFVRIKIY